MCLFSQVEINGAWRTKTVPDPTLLPKGKTHARYITISLLLPLSSPVVMPLKDSEGKTPNHKNSVMKNSRHDWRAGFLFAIEGF